MKLNRKQVTVESGGQRDAPRKFGIADTKLITDILSKQYSNPRQAIVREYACNALDAHTEAGCPEKPIKINAPSPLSPWLEIIDYGNGMSEEHVYDLWGTYGMSTKQKTNSQVGGFGIGSKSGFAYADEFEISSRQNGIQKNFMAYQGTDGPDIEKLGEFPTADPDGITIRIEIKEDDHGSIATEIRNVCQWFDVMPEVTGMSPVEPVERQMYDEEDGFFLISNRGSGRVLFRGSKILVKMGPVVYQTDVDLTTGYNGGVHLYNHNLVLVMNIGDVPIAPDRESIIMDAEVTNKIKALRDVTLSQLKRKFESQYNTEPTAYRAFKKFKSLPEVASNTTFNYGTWDRRLQRASSTDWVNRLATSKSGPAVRNVNLYGPQKIGYNSPGRRPYLINNVVAIFVTEGKCTNYARKVKQWFLDAGYVVMPDNNFVVPVFKGDMNSREFLKFWVAHGRPDVPIIRYSDVNLKATKSKAVKKPRVAATKVWSGGRMFSDYQLDYECKVAVHYLPCFRSEVKLSTGTSHTEIAITETLSERLEQLLKSTGYGDKTIAFIPKTHWNKIPKHWVNLTDVLEKKLAEVVRDKEDLLKYARVREQAHIVNRGLYFFRSLPEPLAPRIKTLIIDNLPDYSEEKDRGKERDLRLLGFFFPWLSAYDRSKIERNILDVIETKVVTKYPLLRNFTHHNSRNLVDHWIEYLDLMDEKGTTSGT